MRLARKYSLSLDLGYNAINFPNYTGADGRPANPKFHHWLVMSEAKRWFSPAFRGHYIGLHLLGGRYNAGGLKFPGFLREGRYKGWLAGGGLSYGYQWRFGSHWGLEASLGAGYAYLEYKKYDCGACGRLQSKKRRHYFGPTKAALSIAYYFGGGREKSAGTGPRPAVERVVERDTVRIIERDTVRIIKEQSERELAEARRSGRADATLYLNFPLDSSVILPYYKNNAEELHKAEILLRDADVRHITITGYASPEGEYGHNLLLSASRAEAVGRWVASVYGISPSLISTSGKGEDWEGLRRAAEDDPNVMCRDKVLEIIDNIDIFSGREKRLMDLGYGRPYNYMLEHIFPWLRRMEMTIEYNHPTEGADEK